MESSIISNTIAYGYQRFLQEEKPKLSHAARVKRANKLARNMASQAEENEIFIEIVKTWGLPSAYSTGMFSTPRQRAERPYVKMGHRDA